jgi:hypothetical protein
VGKPRVGYFPSNDSFYVGYMAKLTRIIHFLTYKYNLVLLHDFTTRHTDSDDVKFLDIRISLLAFNVKLRLSGMGRVEYWELPNVSANTAVAIPRATQLISES